ncbi:MAG: MFS transporter [Lachnospiraceae bacterium]|nr:MFS transporter [Lachnospiraceae bacterium]
MRRKNKGEAQGPSLWTRDFTIITLGSVVSMFGNAMSGFALSLLVLDYTKSSFFYALVIALFTAPNLIMPIFSGAILDRFSRKRTIYTLDFLSAGLYAVSAMLFAAGKFPYLALPLFAVILGSIQSIYMVAYQSFYPLLITEGNYTKAYSISGVLETLSVFMVPLSAFLYNQIGIAPLLGINAVSFLIAAVMETQIKAEEAYIEKQKETRTQESHGRQMLSDIREGFRYMMSERGLLAIGIYFTFSAFAGGASAVIVLPYFKNTFEGGEYLYMTVFGLSVVGRALGGMYHYRRKMPPERKFSIAMFVYVAICFLEGGVLYAPVGVMRAMMFCSGILSVTSYTIRIAATQHYVPDEKKGRFNGAFNLLNTVGSLSGELIAGALATWLESRLVLAGFMAVNLLAAFVILGRRKEEVAAIYNVET